MSEPETQTQPLLRAPSQQTAINVPAAGGGRPTRAYKVAGLTLLACVLIVGQATIAYFLLSQRSDIKSLEEQSNNLRIKLMKGRSGSVGSVPMRKHIPMHIPMNAMPEMMADTVDEEASTGLPESNAPQQATDCQLEAAGLKATMKGFRPTCDERGLYQAKQCNAMYCWCVNQANGQQIPGSMRIGPVRCRTFLAGSLSAALTLPDA